MIRPVFRSVGLLGVLDEYACGAGTRLRVTRLVRPALASPSFR